MTLRYGDPEEWRALRKEWYGKNEGWLKTMGYFEALLVLPSISRTHAKDWDQLVEFVDVHEFGLAFSLLTAIVAKDNPELSNDAYALLESIAARIKANDDDWHGLKRD